MGLLNVEDTLTHMRNLGNTNFKSLISKLHMKPISKSSFCIPLCRLIPLPLVKPIGVQLLENEFVNGYKVGEKVLYALSYNNIGNGGYH